MAVLFAAPGGGGPRPGTRVFVPGGHDNVVLQDLSTMIHTAEYGQPTDDELKTVEQLKECMVEGTVELTDAALLAFVRTRRGDLEKAKAQLSNFSDFAQKWLPKERLKIEDVAKGGAYNPRLIPTRKCDNEGRFTYIMRARSYEPLIDLVEQMRYLWYFVENEAMSQYVQEKGVTLILDMQDVSFQWYKKNIDSRGQWVTNLCSLLTVTLKGLPLRIERVFIVRMSSLFPVIWKIIAPFLEKEFVNMVKFVKKVEDLKDSFEEENLLDELGGKVSYDHDLWVAARKQEEEAAAIKRTPSCHDWANESALEDRMSSSMPTAAVSV